MSVENFDGDGFADQPSVIYGFEDTAPTEGLPDDIQELLEYTDTHTGSDDELEIRELSRSGWGQPGPSPGDVIKRDSTKSTLDTRLPELELPGQRGLKYDDCGEEFPAFACLDHDDDDDEPCGKPIYVGRSCASPTCDRDWPAAIKDKVTRYAGELQAFAKMLHDRHGTAIDFNHVVASLPSFVCDSDEPLERALPIIKTLLEEQWGIEGFAAIYHPFRIKQQYRKDQYSHGGAEGQGDMTWQDVLSEDNPRQYLKFEPHFHLFFPARRKQFSYGVVPGVYEDSGWVFHRIEKPGEDEHTSVEDLEDLVHQMTYCFSHAGVNDWNADRSQLTSRMKGDLATDVEFVQQKDKDRVLAAFCDAAPRLLGVRFTNMNEATCDAIVPSEFDSDEADQDTDDVDAEGDSDDHPLHDVWNRGAGVPSSSVSSGNPWGNEFDVVGDGESSHEDWAGGQESSSSTGDGSASAAYNTAESNAAESDGGCEVNSPIVDDREPCGGTVRPIHEAAEKLDDDEWCERAPYASGLRDAYDEWRRKTGGDEDRPWAPDDDDAPSVVRELD